MATEAADMTAGMTEATETADTEAAGMTADMTEATTTEAAGMETDAALHEAQQAVSEAWDELADDTKQESSYLSSS
jgi:hypothetical protein